MQQRGALASPVCILPGCRNAVSAQGLPCEECQAEFGPHLRSAQGEPLTAEGQRARDRDTRVAQRRQRRGSQSPQGAPGTPGGSATAEGEPAVLAL